MAAQRSTYLPPTVNKQVGPPRSAGAATALDLLNSNTDALLTKPLGGPRLSAAKLARQRYEEALEAKAVTTQGDLLEFDSPVAANASSELLEEIATVAADGFPGSMPGTLWPGDTVLARYGPDGSHYRARVVRVYSSRGCSLADVEWLRPVQVLTNSSEFLSLDLDDSLHRIGLQVGTDVRIPKEGAAREFGPQDAARHAAVENSQADGLLDLLDLDLAAPCVEVSPAAVTGQGSSATMPVAPALHAGYSLPTSQPNSALPAKSLVEVSHALPPAPKSPEERFGFVSDMIFQAADGQGSSK